MYTVSSTISHHRTKENAASSCNMTITDRSPLLPPCSALWHSSWSVIAPFTQTLSGLMRLKVGPLELWNFAYTYNYAFVVYVCVCVCTVVCVTVCATYTYSIAVFISHLITWDCSNLFAAERRVRVSNHFQLNWERCPGQQRGPIWVQSGINNNKHNNNSNTEQRIHHICFCMWSTFLLYVILWMSIHIYCTYRTYYVTPHQCTLSQS